MGTNFYWLSDEEAKAIASYPIAGDLCEEFGFIKESDYLKRTFNFFDPADSEAIALLKKNNFLEAAEYLEAFAKFGGPLPLSDYALHIGKSSAGWCFTLCVYNNDTNKIQTLEDWQEKWKTGSIYDEYYNKLSIEEMMDRITNRSWDDSYREKGWYKKNGAIKGPNGLARQSPDGEFCFGPGLGTWDYVDGESEFI